MSSNGRKSKRQQRAWAIKSRFARNDRRKVRQLTNEWITHTHTHAEWHLNLRLLSSSQFPGWTKLKQRKLKKKSENRINSFVAREMRHDENDIGGDGDDDCVIRVENWWCIAWWSAHGDEEKKNENRRRQQKSIQTPTHANVPSQNAIEIWNDERRQNNNRKNITNVKKNEKKSNRKNMPAIKTVGVLFSIRNDRQTGD